MKNREKVILALDFPKYDAKAQRFVKDLTPFVGIVKVGLQLFIAEGPAILNDFNLPVFLDLKLHDIPDTVEKAIESAANYNVKFLTVHIAQKETMRRAALAADDCGIQLLGVTVLTSMTSDDLDEARTLVTNVQQMVRYRAQFAFDQGINGFVCSGHEVSLLRKLFPEAVLVVPGVRSSGVNPGSQKRIVTPKEAIDGGANYIVVGSQLRDAVDSMLEAQFLLEEIK